MLLLPEISVSFTTSSVRGEAGKDAVGVFYEKVTALSGDQPPVVMVNTAQEHNNNLFIIYCGTLYYTIV